MFQYSTTERMVGPSVSNSPLISRILLGNISFIFVRCPNDRILDRHSTISSPIIELTTITTNVVLQQEYNVTYRILRNKDTSIHYTLSPNCYYPNGIRPLALVVYEKNKTDFISIRPKTIKTKTQ